LYWSSWVSVGRLRGTLTPTRILVLNGGAPGHVFGPVAGILRAVVVNGLVREWLRLIPHEQEREDLLILTGLIEAGKLTPVLDRTYRWPARPRACAAWSRDTHAARLSSPWLRPAGPQPQVTAIMGARCSETAPGWEAGPVPVTISGAPGLLTELTARHSFLRYRVWCPAQTRGRESVTPGTFQAPV
jgi:hypothetical protein